MPATTIRLGGLFSQQQKERQDLIDQVAMYKHDYAELQTQHHQIVEKNQMLRFKVQELETEAYNMIQEKKQAEIAKTASDTQYQSLLEAHRSLNERFLALIEDKSTIQSFVVDLEEQNALLQRKLIAADEKTSTLETTHYVDLNSATNCLKDEQETSRKLRKAWSEQSHKVQVLYSALKDCTEELDELNEEKKKIFQELTEARILLSGGNTRRMKIKLRQETAANAKLQEQVKEMRQEQQYLIARFREASAARKRLELLH